MDVFYTVTEHCLDEHDDPSPWVFVYRTLEEARQAVREALTECYEEDGEAVWETREEVPAADGSKLHTITCDDLTQYMIMACTFEK